jgi:hypothetical protein
MSLHKKRSKGNIDVAFAALEGSFSKKAKEAKVAIGYRIVV